MASTAHNTAVHHDDHGHHHETFLTKYVFSQDHKMIAKQYLILGVLFMGFIGVAMSLLFRLQLAWPELPEISTFSLLGIPLISTPL